MNSKEASSSTSRFPYQVFLSFRGEDTRKAFIDHLYTALDRAGFRTFTDDDGLARGEDIKSELEKAIRESRMSIIVFSKSYASSTWCLDELVMILKRRTNGHVVLPVFYDVDPSVVRKQNGSFKEAFAKHEKKLKSEKRKQKEELKNKVGAWRAALRDVADLAGLNLKTQADGHEARFIQKIINVVGDKISRATLDMDPHLVGMPSRVKNIQLWLEDESTNVGIAAICGMGGIGKTTIAKFLYNFNFSRFESCSFLENVRESSQGQDGLLRLQRQVLSDILKTRKVNLNSVAEGTSKIKDAIHCKRVFLVLDDVDKRDQLDAILGMRDCLFLGSKIIVTTRHEHLLRANVFSKVHRLENLGDEESLELFSWHAFGKCCPDNDYEEVSKRVAGYCGGLPLALKVLGASLSGQSLNVWKSQPDKLETFPVGEILEKLRISYDSLQDEHDKNLFLHLACFFVGNNKTYAVTILDGCEFYTMVGIQNLMDRCLISIDESDNIVMHHLLQETAREIVNQDSTEPGERRILWNHKDAFNVLRHDNGTSRVEGLKLDMCLLKEDKNANTNLGCSLKRYGFSVFSSWLEATCPEISNQVVLEADAFRRMHKLKILQLSHVYISGPYKMLPKELRWLCWRKFPFKSIPSDFPLESLVVLDMLYSSVKNVWEGTKFLEFLKILNLSHSPNLAKTPDFSQMPNLERLLLENCPSLVELHESIGCLKKLILLNLNDCKNLRKLPKSIGMLKCLETLIIYGCSNLEEFPTNMGNMDSLTILKADGIAWNQSPSTSGEVTAMRSFIWPWLLNPRKSPEISWASLPRSLVELSLAGCNLSDDAFSGDLSNLCSLKNINLSGNPISSLPDFIRGLTGLEGLYIQGCSMLRKVDGMSQIHKINVGGNRLLEEVTVRSCHGPKTNCYLDICDHVGKTIGYFKLEPIGNVPAEITKSLGLSNLRSMEDATVKLSSLFGMNQQKLPLQGCHGTHIFDTYVPGSNVPLWFSFCNLGSSVYFTMPSNLNSRVRGLSICSVYEMSCAPRVYDWNRDSHIIISNGAKSLIWSYCPRVFGVGEAGEDMMWLSYWKFGKHLLEAGDELNVSVFGGVRVQVKEVGVRLLYNEEEEEMSSQSDYEENVSHQIHPFGNIIPGNVSAHQPSTTLCQLGCHYFQCEYCQSLLGGQPWIPTDLYDNQECWASSLLVPRTYYVSDSQIVRYRGRWRLCAHKLFYTV